MSEILCGFMSRWLLECGGLHAVSINILKKTCEKYACDFGDLISYRFLFFIRKTRIVLDQASLKARVCPAERGILVCNSDFAHKKSYKIKSED